MRFNTSDDMKKLEKIFMPYLDFSKISCPFKPGTPDKVKKAKADEIVDKLGYDDTGIAADIITKITTNKDW